MGFELINGDCLTEMPKLIERGVKVSLVNADIPYFKVKADEWDRQWRDEKAFLGWVDSLCGLISQVMRPNGSLYLYASPQMARKVGGVAAEHFKILTDVRWRKPPFSTKAEMFRKEDMRAYFPASETILFCEQYESDERAEGEAGYATAERELKRRLYGEPMRQAMSATGTTTHELTEAVGAYGKVNHGGAASNWLNGFNAPTREQYARIWEYLCSKGAQFSPCDYADVRASHDRLRAEHDELKRQFEALRRPFTVSEGAPYTDVWDFPTVPDYPGKHPCEKPYAMMEHIVRASSREGDLVLDLCAGSGVFGEAALANGRNVIAVERDAHWARKAADRASRVSGNRINAPQVHRRQIETPLFGVAQ